MGYYLDECTTGLAELQRRLQNTDLVPSHVHLLEGITAKMAALGAAGIGSIADLRRVLKTKKSLALLADATGIDPGYLSLLRRVVEGFFPKPRPLNALDWLDHETIGKLRDIGVKNTRDLYEAAVVAKALAVRVGVAMDQLTPLLEIADLVRIQWLSPTYARVLVAAGFDSAAKLAKAEPDLLYKAVLKANQGARYYKGTVGMRDIKRLVAAAGYAP